MNIRFVSLVILLTAVCSACQKPLPEYKPDLTDRDVEFLNTFALAQLPPPRQAPDNRFADNHEAAQLGHKLFFDTRLSANGRIACASCHNPALYFTDGLPTGQGIGDTRRNTMSLLTAAWGPWK